MEHAEDLLDRQLSDTAEIIYTLSGGNVESKHDQADRLSFQIWASPGSLLANSANAPESPISVFEEGFRDENFLGYRWRVLSRYYANDGRWIMVAERIDIRISLTNDVIVQSIFPILLSLPILAAIIWLVVSNGLVQMNRLASEVANKRADDLSQLTVKDPPSELASIVSSINDLLARLERSVARERRFSVDSAHELRTPLAAIKVHAHNLVAEHPELDSELREFEHDLGRLGHLIEQMIALYRTSPEHYQARMRRLVLAPVVQAVIGDLYTEFERRQQTISLQAQTEEITGDTNSLKIMIGNLLQNASKYSGSGAEVTVSIEALDHAVRLSVIDNGPGIAEENLPRIKDRFYRSGGDRSAASASGCGLGLSIVEHIAQLHQAVVRISNVENGSGLEVVVDFPLQMKTALLSGG
jgi:two-component system sensor histidine kinase QseC